MAAKDPSRTSWQVWKTFFKERGADDFHKNRLMLFFS